VIELLVQVCQGLPELLGVPIVFSCGELLCNASARQAKAFDAASPGALFRSDGAILWSGGSRGFRLLFFYGFAFPAARHVSIIKSQLRIRSNELNAARNGRTL
jgi:hypothetical protein